MNHKRRRSRLATTPERQDHVAHRPRSDADRVHLHFLFARDRARADQALGDYKDPRVIKGHTFKFSGVHVWQPGNPMDTVLAELQTRGLCAAVPMGAVGEEAILPMALYINDRVEISEFVHLSRAIKGALEVHSQNSQPDACTLADQILSEDAYRQLRLTAQEFLAV